MNRIRQTHPTKKAKSPEVVSLNFARPKQERKNGDTGGWTSRHQDQTQENSHTGKHGHIQEESVQKKKNYFWIFFLWALLKCPCFPTPHVPTPVQGHKGKYTTKEEIQRAPSEDHPCRLTRTSVQVRASTRTRRRSNGLPQRTIHAALRVLQCRWGQVHNQEEDPTRSLRGPSVPPNTHFSAGEGKYTNKEEIQCAPSEDHPCRLTRTSVQVRSSTRTRRRSNGIPQRTIRAA
jgi:hypothetical protein